MPLEYIYRHTEKQPADEGTHRFNLKAKACAIGGAFTMGSVVIIAFVTPALGAYTPILGISVGATGIIGTLLTMREADNIEHDAKNRKSAA